MVKADAGLIIFCNGGLVYFLWPATNKLLKKPLPWHMYNLSAAFSTS